MLNIVILVSVVLIVAILATVFRVHTLIQVVKGKSDEGTSKRSNQINAILFILFLVFGIILFFGYSYTQFDRYTVPVASEHGEITFMLFWITMAVTCFVFIVTHIFLFWFAFKYQHKENHRATFYAHNNTLEIIWTAIPAFVLIGLVGSGLMAWNDITGEAPGDAEVVEIFGYQFAWAARYPGADGKLGPYDYQLIDDDNKLGVDFSNQYAKDDIIPREIHIPKGKPVLFKIRARDVIHSVYVPWFRLQMNAVPGMPTQFWFTPTKSTADMAEETGNPDFQYELVCNKICGRAHFGMKAIIIVDEPADYEKWKASQKSWLSKNPDYLAEMKSAPVNAEVAIELESGVEAEASL